MTCGIYKLVFENTDKVYVGQSVNIEKRFKSHLLSFINKTCSSKLYNAYLTFGKPTLVILEEVENTCNLNVAENNYISKLSAFTNGFNSLEYAESVPNRHEVQGSGLYKYTLGQVIDSFNLIVNTKLSNIDISSITGVSDSMLHQLKSGNSYKWLKDIDTDNYIKYIENRAHGNAATSKGIDYPLIVDPTGKVHHVDNRSAFSREHNLDCGALGRVLRGTANSHKGWKLYES